MRIAILDDYQSVALALADWTPVLARAEITVFTDTIADQAALIDRLSPFDILCVMRERTPLPASLLQALPNLKMITSTGPRNASIDTSVTSALGISIAHTGYFSEPTVEMTWALIHGLCRHLVSEANSVRAGGWQKNIGVDLHGKTLGILGLGNVGEAVARVGAAFGMNIIAWSQNLTAAVARSKGATYVSKETLFEASDILSIHTVLSARTRGLIDAEMLALMKPSAYLVNMSRGQIINEDALIEALVNARIAGAGLDVFDLEPLAQDHPYRRLPNVLATPHLGYVSEGLYKVFYKDSINNILAWLDSQAA